ncbi:hypothetical protein G6M89_09155 [Natronolimnobius sp. AArcel1]|uniref:hypothetical protein n=1 Tax=Natronolimnobius sp. AArcel1 TaxID=1679093 RepID=UPI0013ED29A6|nr:hypothetical protein [Natronolimnobius sp. AArcel1]NGM69171.1 hypothetical protein [Natronolimnobius sp. AArcel1]
MYDNTDSEEEFELRSNIPDEELAFEFIEHLDIFSEYREFLEEIDKTGTFRLKHRDEVDFSDVRFMSSAFLIEEDEDKEMGRATDWTTTERCSYLLQNVPEDVTMSEEEVNAYLTVGTDIFALPHPKARWQYSDIEDLDIEDRELGVLRNAGLIKPTNTPRGHSWTWKTTDRLAQINALLEGLVHA